MKLATPSSVIASMRLALLAVLVPLSASADALTDLRTSLGQLTANAPVHGTFEVTSTNNNSEEGQAFAGKASCGFEVNDTGLHLIYPKAALAQASQEARSEAVDPNRQTPVRSGMSRIRALSVASMLDAATTLSIDLQGAQLTDMKPANYRGRSSRLLNIKLNPKMSKGESKHVKKIDATMSVWLGDDGIPIAADRAMTIKASFMLMSFEHNEKHSFTFARVGDRLIATRHDTTTKSDGMGQHDTSQVSEVVSVQER